MKAFHDTRVVEYRISWLRECVCVYFEAVVGQCNIF